MLQRKHEIQQGLRVYVEVCVISLDRANHAVYSSQIHMKEGGIMFYLGIFLIVIVMAALFVFSSLLIGVRITTIIWLTATFVMAVFAFGFYQLMGGTL